MDNRALVVVLAGLAGAACGRSQTGPTAVQDAPQSIRLGISAHTAVPASAPFSIVRRDAEDLSWAPAVEAQGRQAIILVSYGDKTTIPARVAEAARRFPSAWIEVWNEPNLPQFWEDTPDPEAYVAMVAAARAAAPDARLIAGSVGGPSWAAAREYLRRCADAGLGQHVDLIGIHGYPAHPDALPGIVADTRAMFGRPVAITEWGFDAGPAQLGQVQAAVGAAARSGVEFLTLYTMYDTANEAQGLADADGTPRPALEWLSTRR